MEIIVFALIVQLTPDDSERVASYWVNQSHCIRDARILTKREENYKPALAFCRPTFVNPEATEINGYIPLDDKTKK